MPHICTHRDTFKSYNWIRVPSTRGRMCVNSRCMRRKRREAKRRYKVRADQVGSFQPDKSDLIGGCRPAVAGMAGERETEKPGIAMFATKWPQENAG